MGQIPDLHRWLTKSRSTILMQAIYSQVNRLRRGVALMEICAMIKEGLETLRSYWRDVRPQDWLCPGDHQGRPIRHLANFLPNRANAIG